MGLTRFIDLGSLSGGFKLSQAMYIKIVGGSKSAPTNNKEENKKNEEAGAPKKKILTEREVEAV